MFVSSRHPILASFAVLIATACGNKEKPSTPGGVDHEALRDDIVAIQADIRATKSNTEALQADLAPVKTDSAAAKLRLDALKDSLTTLTDETNALRADTGTLKSDTTALKSDTTALKSDTTALKSDATALKSDTTALKESVGTDLHTRLLEVQNSLGALPSGHSIHATLMAARRYSLTCNPATDTWLRSAWPGMTDAEITEACRRDGRWHYLGTMLDIITRSISLPEGMEVGLTTYANSIAPVTVNGWNRGIRLCGSPIAVGDVHIVGGTSFVYQCITFMDNLFTVTHRQVGQTTTESSQRDYTSYSGSNEAGLPCTSTHSTVSCSISQASASYWRIYVRQ
jgi:hypothetical protein